MSRFSTAHLPTSRPRLRTALGALALTAGTLFALSSPAAAVPMPTTMPAPACTVSGVAVPVAPVDEVYFRPFAALTATNGTGLWAGIRYDGGYKFQVVTWRAGRYAVLDTFDYNHVSQFDWKNSVKVAGVTASGAVIVAAQPPLHSWNARTSYRYQNGHRTTLAVSPDWPFVDATSVSPDGRIAGDIKVPGGGERLVEWGRDGRVGVLSGYHISQPVIDSSGNVGFNYGYHGTQYAALRRPDGSMVYLGSWRLSDTSNSYIVAAGGPYIYGESTGHAVRFDTRTAANLPAKAIVGGQASGSDYRVETAASNGVLIYDDSQVTYRNERRLLDAYHDPHTLPAFGLTSDGALPDLAVDPSGLTSYTATDGSARFYRCPLNYAAHNPRGTMYRATAANGQTILSGGAFDADNRATHLQVDLYDQTTGKTFLGRTPADQVDAWFTQTYGATGNHRYRLAIPTAAGTHRYCAYALNISYGNTNALLGCITSIA